MSNTAASTAATCAIALALIGSPALAQYKVVGPDGKITYTDRPSTDAGQRVTPVSRDARSAAVADAATSGELPLPPELRQAAARFPVVLYASADCEPCDAGRKLLQLRGIPYSERQLASEDDAEAMTRLTGGRTVPTLTIGAQTLRGLSETDWQAYLDFAGYPRESRLPRDATPQAARPLTERKAAPAPRSVPLVRPAPEPTVTPAETAPPPPAAPPGGIRF